MNLLILGGTRFVGRHMTRAALECGHSVTLFNRGNSNPELFPEVEKLRGDRDGDMSALEGRTWDAVLDTSGYVPRIVKRSAELIDAAHYTFISSISVYPDDLPPHADENADVQQLEDPTTEEVTGETYGGLKVLCEEVVQEVYPDAALILRPGIVVGPFDPTDRFTYWPHRVDEGGEVLAPEGPDVPIQFIDARDLADFTISSIEAKRTGTYNVVSNGDQFTLGELLETSRKVSQNDASFSWVYEKFLLEKGIDPFADLPLWIPKKDQNFFRVSSEKALGQGLEIRSLELSVRDTLGWDKTRPEGEFNRKLSKEKEQEILRGWRERQ